MTTSLSSENRALEEPTGTSAKPNKIDYSTKHKAGQEAIRNLHKPVRGRLLIGQILVIISGILSIAPYVALVELGELFLTGYRSGKIDTAHAWDIAFMLVSAFCARLGIYFVALLITHFADLKLRDLVRRRIVDQLAKVRLSWFSESTSGNLRKIVQDDTATVHTVIAHGPIELLNAVVTPLALLCYAFYIDWRLGLLSIATIPLFLLTYGLQMRGMSEKTAELNVRLAKVSETMVEFVAGINIVKAFGRVGQAHTRYIKAADEFSTFYRNWCMPLVSMSCLALAWISIPVLLVVNLGVGALLINAGMVDIVQVITCALIALVLPGAITTVASITWSYQLAGSAAVRIHRLLEIPGLPFADISAPPSNNDVEVQKVSYIYPPQDFDDEDSNQSEPTQAGVKAVDDVSLQLPTGTVTALVGPSGSGKSTLATLIARFDDPTSGLITLGDTDLRLLSSDSLYSRVAFVLQDPQLLSTSIRENITLGKPDASDEEVIAAAKSAQIHDFITSLPKGYDTVLGTDTHLSGGQQQRIAIARALIKDAPVLILDEATSFTDPECEADIQQALSALIRNRTVLVIAHRPGVIRGANQIVVLDKGKVNAIGSHEDLLDNIHYRKLLTQSGVSIDADLPGGFAQ